MSGKVQFRIRMTLYAAVLVLAELLQTAVFGGIELGLVPCVMPMAVVCISMFEGAEKGGVFGLIGGCIWAWSTGLTMYGAWCIVIVTVIGVAAGMVTERFLLRGVKTALCTGGAALLLTDGVYVTAEAAAGRVPVRAFMTVFLPECLLSLLLCLMFYAITAKISRIGGFHG